MIAALLRAIPPHARPMPAAALVAVAVAPSALLAAIGLFWTLAA